MRTQTYQLPEVLRGARRLLFYGDSLTDGSDYPDYVVNTLNRVFPAAGFEILNSAICGNTAADLRQRLAGDVIARRPDVVILCIGTNDAARARSTAEYAADMEYIVPALRGAGAKVLLMAPSHLRDAVFEERLLKEIDVLRRLAREHRLVLADAHELFTTWERQGRAMLGPDGVHHGADGFEGMARAVLIALGLGDAAMDRQIRSWPHVLLEWDTSAPRPPAGDYEAAQTVNWQPYDRQAMIAQQPWWNAPFTARGAWMPFPDANPQAVAFGRTVFHAPQAGPYELQVGGAPKALWLNGRAIPAVTGRGYHPNADRWTVDMRAGRNEIVGVTDFMLFVGVAPCEPSESPLIHSLPKEQGGGQTGDSAS